CEEHKGITESVLGEKMQFKEEKLAEKSTQAEVLRYKALVHSQALELTQLRKKLREGREASLLLSQHLKALLTDDDPDNHQGQDLREQLAEGRRLAECLVRKLSPENDEVEDENVKDEKVEKVGEPLAPREVQETEEKEFPQNSLEEYSATCSICRDPSDSHLPQRCAKITREEEKVDSALDVGSESSHYKGEEEVLNILP
uniref:Olduvai domain-containing protein n=1 Tax=Rhinopithecus bieti TaxID=61621 RepID=A0A2K6MYP4_RHIBE